MEVVLVVYELFFPDYASRPYHECFSGSLSSHTDRFK